MSRLDRRHDKLLRSYLDAARERADADAHGKSRGQLERLSVRERALAAAVRRIRSQLGLPETFDHDLEAARITTARARRVLGRRRGVVVVPIGSDRPRVVPVAAAKRPPVAMDEASPFDLNLESASLAARFCARRAADEVLEHRASPALGHFGGQLRAWPDWPLARTAHGKLYAGSAGRFMGELVAHAFASPSVQPLAAIAVRNYVEEFTGVVIAALNRERDIAARLGTEVPTDPADKMVELRHQLAEAACQRIAAEARAIAPGALTASEIAAMVDELYDNRVGRSGPGF